MSLINDALRRASQSDKNRANLPPTPTGMEAVPSHEGSRMTMILAVVVVVALLLAGLLFWQLWKTHNNPPLVARDSNIFPPVTLQVAPPPAATPKPVAVAPVAPVAAPAPARPAPAPVVVAAPPVVAVPVAPPVVAPPVAAPVAAAPVVAPVVAVPDVWPTDLKLSAVFFSRVNPRAMINGSIYGVGDQVEGVTVKKIGTSKVTLELNGHTKELLEGQ